MEVVGRRRGRPPKVDGPATRDRLLDAALDLFARQGFAATTVRQIAAEVGVRDSAIYGHFTGKQAIYDALFVSAGPASLDALGIDLDSLVAAGPQVAIPQLVDLVWAGWAEPRSRRFLSVMLREGTSGLAAAIEEARDHLQEPFLQWQRSGQVRADVPARQLVWELFASLQVPRVLHLPADATDADLAAARRLVDDHVACFLTLVTPPGGSSS